MGDFSDDYGGYDILGLYEQRDEDRRAQRAKLLTPFKSEQEPVAWTLLLVGKHNGIIGKAGEKFLGHPEHYDRIDVYTAPPQRPWVDLTDDEIDAEANSILTSDPVQWWRRLARAVLAKSKEKNT